MSTGEHMSLCSEHSRLFGKCCECLRARVDELKGQMNTKYWDGIRDDNIVLKAQVNEFKAKANRLQGELETAEVNFQEYRKTMKSALGWK